MNRLVLIAWLLMVLLMPAVVQGSCCVKYDNDDVCYIHNTKARMKCFQDYHSDQYDKDCKKKLEDNAICTGNSKCEKISIFSNEQKRDNLYFDEGRKKIAGLAMSGGGIRSHAFQLGILSGLHAEDARQRKECEQTQAKEKKCEDLLKGKAILQRIGYISGVSGGSWAAGHYKAYKYEGRGDELYYDNVDYHDEKFFSNIEKFIVDAGEDCHDPQICLFNSYEEQAEILKKTGIFSSGLHPGFMGHDIWQDMIFRKVLHSKSIKLTDLEDTEVLRQRPLLILNATHEAETAFLAPIPEHHFPFEFTSKYIGTIVDNGNIDREVRSSYGLGNDDTTQISYQGAFFYGEMLREMNLTLDQVLAISGAVTPPTHTGMGVLVWKFPIDYHKIEEANGYVMARKEYTLSDGGHSENLGALPLIERELDLVIISDAAHDPDYEFDDLRVLKSHAMKLLGMQIDVDMDNTTGFKYQSKRDIPPSCEEMVNDTIDKRLSASGLKDNLGGSNIDYIVLLNNLIEQPSLYDSLLETFSKNNESLSKTDEDFLDRFLTDQAKREKKEIAEEGKRKKKEIVKEMKPKIDDIKKDPQIRELVRMTNDYRKAAYLRGHEKWTIARLNRRILDILLQDKKLTRKQCDTTYTNEKDVELFALDPNDINIVTGTYRKQNPKNTESYKDKKIIYIRAHKDIKLSDKFMKYLDSNEYRRIRTYLRYGNVDFPQDKTFVKSYEIKLIKAYYILGKYLGQQAYDTMNRVMEESPRKSY
jgi:hypothetical protein